MYEQDKQTGVSPVIGVILMVAVTVALVALVTVVVFDIGGEISESPDAAVELQSDLGDQDVTATVLRNENVENFVMKFKTLDDQGDDVSGTPSTTDNNTWTTETDELSDASAGASFSVSDTTPQVASTNTATDINTDGSGTNDSLKPTDTVIIVATMPDGSQEVLTTTDYDFT